MTFETDSKLDTAIRRYRSDDLQLLELLAADAWSGVVEAKDYLSAESDCSAS